MDAIDTIISEAQTQEQPQSVDKTPDNKEQPAPEQKVEESPKKETETEEEQDNSELSDRAKKLLAKKNAAIGKKTAKLYEARAAHSDALKEIERLRSENAKYQQPKRVEQQDFDPSAPREEDYPNDYGSYLEARALHKFSKQLEARDASTKKTQEETAQSTQIQNWESERKNALDIAGDVYIKDNPEIAELVQQNAETIRAFPPEINRAIFESDPMEVVKAFHHMARNGTLDEISDMSYADAKVAIVRAANARTVSKAPVPLSAARGNGSVGKSLDNASDDDIRAWLK